VLLAIPAAVDAAPAGAPVNDDYLDSLQLNAPKTRLDRHDTLSDSRNTSLASVQSNVFAPKGNGPAEATACGSSSIGKTVWYDFYPDVDGTVRLRANGFDTGIAVVPFNPSTSLPDFNRRQCFNQLSSTSEEALVQVAGGDSYTVQVGGVGGIGGNLEFLFDFLADTDGDGTPDDADVCDLRSGRTKSGCVRADATLRARPTAAGIEVGSLKVKAPRGFKVSVRCPGCPPQAKRARTVSFKRLHGRGLRAGTNLVIRITKKHNIGAYFKYRIVRGNFKPKVERCLRPGSRKPRRRCTY
jgi:hypothetical protein